MIQRTDAIATAAELADGRRDAIALIDDTLARIRAGDETLRAFTAVLTPAAAHTALDEARRSGGPLHGQPVALKDIFDTRALPTRYGSALYEVVPAHADAAIVGVVRRAGGVVIGKSSTTEFAFLNPTPTLNPNAPGRTPGGSSAGSAAAVAAGLVPFAIGTQTGGSIIRPASYCGVTGFKPSFGLLPTGGLKCFSWSLDTVGLFAASVSEVAFFAQALSGHDLAVESKKTWTVGVPNAYPWSEISSSARLAIDTGIAALQRAGATVRRIDLPGWAKDAFEAQDVVQGFEAWRALAGEVENHPQGLSAVLRDYLLGAGRITGAQYEAAQRVARQARRDCAALFDGCDALMTPSAPDEPPLGYGSTGASIYNRAWTLLGVPCVNVAGAVGVNGAPMGLQVIAGPHDDRGALSAAAFLETALTSPRAG